MCGFPLMHLDKHLKTLVQHHNRSVAMCEEFPRPRLPSAPVNSKPTFDRRVVRVLTPGTLTDESFLNPYDNNFLLAVSVGNANDASCDMELGDREGAGLAWIDISTGEFFTKLTTIQGLRDHLARLNPREVVINETLQTSVSHPMRVILKEEGCLVSFSVPTPGGSTEEPSETSDLLDDITEHALPTEEIFSKLETDAITLLTGFLHANLLEHSPLLLRPAREASRARMQIDAHTLKALEIREGISEGGSSGSLLSAIKRTVTSGGSRLLTRWLCKFIQIDFRYLSLLTASGSPSTSLDEITARQNLVALFQARPSLRTDLMDHLKSIEDASRIMQKLALGKGDFDDLVSIQQTVEIWDSIKKRVFLEKYIEQRELKNYFKADNWKSLDLLMARLTNLHDVASRIALAIETKIPQRKTAELDPADDVEPDGQGLPSTIELPSKLYSMPGAETKWNIKPEYV